VAVYIHLRGVRNEDDDAHLTYSSFLVFLLEPINVLIDIGLPIYPVIWEIFGHNRWRSECLQVQLSNRLQVDNSLKQIRVYIFYQFF
jgi:hypothetical protein